MYKKINITNVRYNKINTNKNRYIKSSYKNILKLKTRKKTTFRNILLKKIIVNRTKLRYTQQKTINDYNSIK